jgi:hypothetical protein
VNRFTSFLAGIVVGVIGLYGSMHFYVVKSDRGLEVVRKIQPQVEMPYVDIRNFTINDWRDRSALAAALSKGGKTDLIGGSAVKAVEDTVSSTIDRWATDKDWSR